ncbi:MAG: thioredoxin reductase [Proteiniphilum acetatigenes]|uniref:Thioredoxin reductase n=1 Tax=Proteiniphilum acetatigenes TaxID=294710 RepID=A0A117M0V2_9BACT|nr:MAG: thioredoxin reductase [Proteiniphilum acetatigenes]HCC85973.1 pyridine nucleotide-disulfide oxidoreductase [Porphyromonadaceae bacterium]
MEKIYDIMILGAGAAGLSAGIYTSRGKLDTLILSEGVTGGQMVLTNEIANYPGVEMIKGYELADIMKRQAKSFGCTLKTNVKIVKYRLTEEIKEVELEDGRVFRSRAVILAPGGKPRSLNIPGEKEFEGRGISYCATCDADFFRDKRLIVVGGGNSALEEAVTLTHFASQVTIVHQFDHFQAFAHAVEEAERNPKISFVMESELRAYLGNGTLQKVQVEQLKTGELTYLETDGVFVFIGYIPNTEAFEGLVKTNERGEFVVDQEMKTSLPGVFAAGDCVAKRYRQVTTAVSDGTIAALSAIEYIRTKRV